MKPISKKRQDQICLQIYETVRAWTRTRGGITYQELKSIIAEKENVRADELHRMLCYIKTLFLVKIQIQGITLATHDAGGFHEIY